MDLTTAIILGHPRVFIKICVTQPVEKELHAPICAHSGLSKSEA